MKTENIRFYSFALLIILCLCGSPILAQEKTKNYGDFCTNQNYNGDKVAYNETREMTLPAQSLLNVDGERNGGIRVKGENRSDVLVKACVRAWANTDEAARNLANNIRIEKGSTIRAESSTGENWSVSYEIHVPRASNLKLTTHNGGIGISGVEGNIEFEALNGGVHLSEVAGDVRGKTTNGGIHVELFGNGWRGAGLDAQTTNGGVHLSMPENYAARIETGTVNGGFKSDIAALQVERKERTRAVRLSTDLNGGGAPVRLTTTNGGVKISSASKTQ